MAICVDFDSSWNSVGKEVESCKADLRSTFHLEELKQEGHMEGQPLVETGEGEGLLATAAQTADNFLDYT